MWNLTTEDADHFMSDASDFQGLNIVSYCLLVNFHRQAVIPLITRQKWAQLSPGDEVLYRVQVRVITLVFGNIGYVYIVKSSQVIEMENVVLSNMCPLDKIPYNSGIIRYLVRNTEGTI